MFYVYLFLLALKFIKWVKVQQDNAQHTLQAKDQLKA